MIAGQSSVRKAAPGQSRPGRASGKSTHVGSAEAMIDQMAGLVLTKLGGRPARIAGADLGLRRRAEAVLHELRTEIAEAATNLADQAGEPASDDDA